MKPITATAEQIVDAITPVINSCLVHSNRSIPRELLIEAIEGMNHVCPVCEGRGVMVVKIAEGSELTIEGVVLCHACQPA